MAYPVRMTPRLRSARIGGCLALALSAAAAPLNPVIRLSIIGTTDLHGYVFPRNGNGGLALLGGYLRNLRAARTSDLGGVVLVDSGDTYQGGIESDLSEGAVVIDAYNALGYSAGAIGNHDFDFGAVDTPRGRQTHGDPQGALKAVAARAHFPLLTANLVEEATGRRVDWPNVRPSVLLDVVGVKVGIVGVMTTMALRATLPSNVRGLRVTPIAAAIVGEATRLRAAGAQVVVVGSHAGGSCTQFDDPRDLSSCDPTSEIFAVAQDLPTGLVDVIAAGHTHEGLGHIVNGVAIMQAYALGRSFGRVDVLVDRESGRVADMRVFAPRDVCARQTPGSEACAEGPTAAAPAVAYEGRAVVADADVERAMAPQLERVRALRATLLGGYLETPLSRSTVPESALGNLFADALREGTGADVAINNNGGGGLRADLPSGPLTFGHLYDVFPFDNRVARIRITADQLSRAIASRFSRPRRVALGVSGIRVRVTCSAEGLHVELFHPSGAPWDPNDVLTLVTMDSMVGSSNFGMFPALAADAVADDAPIMREVVEDWLGRRDHVLRADQFVDAGHRRWDAPSPMPASCLPSER